MSSAVRSLIAPLALATVSACVTTPYDYEVFDTKTEVFTVEGWAPFAGTRVTIEARNWRTGAWDVVKEVTPTSFRLTTGTYCADSDLYWFSTTVSLDEADHWTVGQGGPDFWSAAELRMRQGTQYLYVGDEASLSCTLDQTCTDGETLFSAAYVCGYDSTVLHLNTLVIG